MTLRIRSLALFAGSITALAALSLAPDARAGGLYGAAQEQYFGSLGVRSTLLRSPGLDPFASDDLLVQGSLSLGRSIFSSGPWTLAGAGSFAWGGRSDSARGAPSRLFAYGLGLGPEVRWYAAPRFYAFARLIPTVTFVTAHLGEDDATASGMAVPFGADASLGAAFGFLPHRDDRHFQLWLNASLGYALTTDAELTLSDPSGPHRAAALALPDLAMSGLFLNVSLTFSGG